MLVDVLDALSRTCVEDEDEEEEDSEDDAEEMRLAAEGAASSDYSEERERAANAIAVPQTCHLTTYCH